MSEEKIIPVKQSQLKALIEQKSKAERELAELRGDVDFLLEAKRKIEAFQHEKFAMAKLKKAYDRQAIPELLELDRAKLEEIRVKYNFDLPFKI